MNATPGCEECREAQEHLGHYADSFILGECEGTHLYNCSNKTEKGPAEEGRPARCNLPGPGSIPGAGP